MILSSQLTTADWNVWALCADGDFFMLPILVMLLIVIYVFSERVYFIGRSARFNEGLLQRLKDYVHENEIESADNLCRTEATASAAVVRKGLSLLGRPVSEISDAMHLVACIEAERLQSIIRWLPFTAAAAPLAGLLGAMMGLLRYVFENPDVMSCPQKLFTPLMTVVVGVIVGLVALCAYQFLLAQLNTVRLTLDRVIERFLTILNEPVV